MDARHKTLRLTPTGGFGVVTRWMYDWIRVIPKPDRAANPDSITFVEAGAETEYEDSQTKWEGSYTGFGFGPALNLMEQNNREVGSVSGRGGPYAKVAPGFPLQESESGSTRTNYLMPEDWSVQPISVNTIVVMYLVHSQRFADYYPEGGSVSDDLQLTNLVPCFQLTNALGRAWYFDGSRGTTCS